MIYYIIEGGGDFAVQHKNGETIASGNSSATTALSPNITVANSVLYMGAAAICGAENETNSSAAGETIYIKHFINSVSQTGQERYSNPAVQMRFSFQSVDFTAGI